MFPDPQPLISAPLPTGLLIVGHALLIVGHGTRDRTGIAEFWQLIERIRIAAAPHPVVGSFLELAEPSIEVGLRQLLEQQIQQITVVPLLLFSAGHAKRDIPDAVEAALERWSTELHGISRPTVQFTPAFESNPHLLRLSTRRFDEAVARHEPVARSQILLLIVSRGSSDRSATAAVRHFTAQRAEQSPVARAEVCFVAVERPNLSEGFAAAAIAGFRRVVVQPHLLFSGLVLNEIRAVVELARGEFPQIEWLLTEHLGAEDEIVQAVVEGSRVEG